LAVANDCNFLLHEDLHHENILFQESGDWIAIDPKGVVGPKVMEFGRFIHNFLVEPSIQDSSEDELANIIKSRILMMRETSNYSEIELAKVTF
jgi:streptomycin 6-kinase